MSGEKRKKEAIVLLAYRRPQHLAKVLEGLRREGARTLTVCIDAADSPEAKAAQEEIATLLEGIQWADMTARWRTTHQGLAAAVCNALEEAFDEHDRVIFIEDDCYPRTGFLAFMRAALDAYEDEPKIRSICGYRYPVASKTPGTEVLRQKRFCPWGWATWKDRWREYPKDLRALLASMDGIALPPDIQRDSQNETILDGRGHIWSLSWILQHYMTDTWCVVPPTSLVDNIGFDGSGVHGLETEHFSQELPAVPMHATLHFPSMPMHDDAHEAAIDAYLNDGPIFVKDETPPNNT